MQVVSLENYFYFRVANFRERGEAISLGRWEGQCAAWPGLAHISRGGDTRV